MDTIEKVEGSPQVIEAFQGYAPPFNAAKAVRRMLRVVPPKFLIGLHTIVLTNVAALSHDERERRGRTRFKLRESRGYYNEKWKGQPARITILVDNLEKPLGRSWLGLAFVRDLELSEVLFHELGHHIHRVHKPVYEDREDAANKWGKKLSRKFMQDRYWYLLPIVVPIALLLGLKRDIAKLYHKIHR